VDREKLIEKLEYVRESTSEEATEGLLTGLIRSLEEERMFRKKEAEEEEEENES